MNRLPLLAIMLCVLFGSAFAADFDGRGGNITGVTNIVATGSIRIGSQNVCLADGTNCANGTAIANVSGTGASGTVARWGTNNSIGNSIITDTGSIATVTGVLKVNSSSTTGSFFVMDANGTTAIFVNGTNGNVGLGTSNPSQRLHVRGVATFVDIDNTTDAASKGLQLRADAPDTGSAMVFWAHPNSTNRSYLIGQQTWHGPASGQPNYEVAWYNTDNSSAHNLVNVFKFLSNVSDTPLLLTGATGIAKSSGATIRMGESILGGGTSSVDFYDYIKMKNTYGIIIDDAAGTDRNVLIYDSSDDLYIKNEGLYANSGRIIVQNRNSGDTLTTRMTIFEDGNVSMDNTAFKLDALRNFIGLSTATPGNPLHVQGTGVIIKAHDSSSTSNSEAQIMISRSTSDSTNSTGIAIGANRTNTGSAGTTDFVMYASTGTTMTERMRIVGNTGRVGIGTIAPNASLQVVGGIIANNLTTGNLSLTSAPIQCSGENYFLTYWNGTHGICTLFNGSIGSGTGTVNGSGSNSYLAYWNGTNTVTHANFLYVNPTNGFLGIGTATPGFQLDVNGNISVGGFVNVYNGLNVFSGGSELQYTRVNGNLNQTSGLAFLRPTNITSGTAGTSPLVIQLPDLASAANVRIVNATGETVFAINSNGITSNLTMLSPNGTTGTCYMNNTKSWVCV